MKRAYTLLVIAAMVLFSGCGVVRTAIQGQPGSGNDLKTFQMKNDTMVAPDGTEYVFVCNEGFLELLGKKSRIGVVKGDEGQLSYGFENGLYACEQDAEQVMLLRYMPDSEWGSFYRKKTAPALDISIQNCIRLELVGYPELQSEENMFSAGAEHITCGKGIAGKEKVAAFFEAVMSTGPAVGLNESVEMEDGTPVNIYEVGNIYGYFEGETAAVIPFTVTSYDDKAFSVMIDHVDYVLPLEYLEQLVAVQ